MGIMSNDHLLLWGKYRQFVNSTNLIPLDGQGKMFWYATQETECRIFLQNLSLCRSAFFLIKAFQKAMLEIIKPDKKLGFWYLIGWAIYIVLYDLDKSPMIVQFFLRFWKDMESKYICWIYIGNNMVGSCGVKRVWGIMGHFVTF